MRPADRAAAFDQEIKSGECFAKIALDHAAADSECLGGIDVARVVSDKKAAFPGDATEALECEPMDWVVSRRLGFLTAAAPRASATSQFQTAYLSVCSRQRAMRRVGIRAK